MVEGFGMRKVVSRLLSVLLSPLAVFLWLFGWAMVYIATKPKKVKQPNIKRWKREPKKP